jgi:peptidoglycan/xylan/chitin deacetylase (PgdA/CDA1 family)
MARQHKALVALTFDDGPSPDTSVVLDVLKAHDLKATFFMIGQAVEQFPQVARRIVAEDTRLVIILIHIRFISFAPQAKPTVNSNGRKMS